MAVCGRCNDTDPAASAIVQYFSLQRMCVDEHFNINEIGVCTGIVLTHSVMVQEGGAVLEGVKDHIAHVFRRTVDCPG